MQITGGRRDRRSLWDKFWKDKRGDVVVWQFPNALLLAWVITTIISLLFNGTISNVFLWIAEASLILWSLLEIFKGVNYFRRLLGLVVLACAIATIIQAL